MLAAVVLGVVVLGVGLVVLVLRRTGFGVGGIDEAAVAALRADRKPKRPVEVAPEPVNYYDNRQLHLLNVTVAAPEPAAVETAPQVRGVVLSRSDEVERIRR